jgi:FMN phosphatase YigB (HAD superfamily)
MAGSVASPVDRHRQIRAVLFDLDGTLYSQRRLRALMAIELMTLLLSAPVRAPRQWRALAAYRRAQDQLRSAGPFESIPAAQIEAAAALTHLAPAEVEALVEEWMMRRPLRYLLGCRVAGLVALLDWLGVNGVAGVLSDYPAHAKLAALGLAGVSAGAVPTDPDIGAEAASVRVCTRLRNLARRAR